MQKKAVLTCFLGQKISSLGKLNFVKPIFFLAIISFNLKKLTILNSMLLIPSFRSFSHDLHENRGYHGKPILIQTTRLTSKDSL